MMETNLIKNINELYLLKNKKIDSLCNKIIKKMSFNSSHDLYNLKELCYWLYIYEYNADLKRLFPTILSLSFVGNWDIWTPIELMQSLVYYITIKKKDSQSVANTALKNIMQAETDNENIYRRCNGSLLKECEDKVQQYTILKKNNNLKSWLLYEMEELMLIYALGGSNQYPLQRIEERVEKIKKELQSR